MAAEMKARKWIEKLQVDRNLYCCFRGKEMDTEKGGLYDRTLYTNRLWVSSPVMVRQIGFFGPFKSDRAIYDVHIDIFCGNNNIYTLENEHYLSKHVHCTVEAKKQEVYLVDIEDGFFMQEMLPYYIRFQLDGQETASIKQNKTLCKIDVSVNERCEPVTFDWFVGSHQMPVITFNVPTEAEMARHYISLKVDEPPEVPSFCICC